MKQGLVLRFAQYLITACMLLAACGTASAESVGQLVTRAQHRDAAAMRTLGIRMYKGGYAGIPTNRKTGLQWLNMAAEKKDGVALLFLGDIYANGYHVPVNLDKAENYYHKAKEYGHQNADERLAALVEKRAADAANTQVAVKAPKVSTLSYGDAADSIAEAAIAAKISRIAVIPFMCNGNASTSIAETVRGKLLEKLVDHPDLQCYDRGEMQLVATEAGLTCPGELPENAEAVLTGEVFCAPSNPIGYVTYRLISTTNSKILAVGFKQVKWKNDQIDMFSGSARSLSPAAFSLIEQSQLDDLKKKAAGKLQGEGVAMVYDGTRSEGSTMEARMAYAQVLEALFQASVAIYEREFFKDLAEENALGDRIVSGGVGTSAVGHTLLRQSKGAFNTLAVQVLGVPGNNLLLTTQLKQVRGSASDSRPMSTVGNSFKTRLARLDNAEQDVKLVYEVEVVIDEDYVSPVSSVCAFIRANNYVCGPEIDYRRLAPMAISSGARSLFEAGMRYIHRLLPEDDKLIERYMEFAAVYGLQVSSPETGVEGSWYVGPASMCFDEINKNLCVRGESSFGRWPVPHENVDCQYELQKPLFLMGVYKEGNYCYDYKYSIQWRDGLPYKVYAKIDLTPMKDKLLKKTDNEND